MNYTNLDIILRRTLLEQGLPIHFYSEALYHGCTALRELTIDTLKVINTRNLPVGDYGEIDLPEDYIDDVSLSYDAGLILRPIPHRANLNPLRVHSATTGLFEGQPKTDNLNRGDLFYPFVGYTWYWNVSDYGEPTGRVFGAGGGTQNGYEVFKERRQIQLYGCVGGNTILQYISDGQSLDSASMVDTLAFTTIQNFIIWKCSPNANNEYSPEASMYFNSKRKLRARLNDLTATDIKNIFRNNFHASIKN